MGPLYWVKCNNSSELLYYGLHQLSIDRSVNVGLRIFILGVPGKVLWFMCHSIHFLTEVGVSLYQHKRWASWEANGFCGISIRTAAIFDASVTVIIPFRKRATSLLLLLSSSSSQRTYASSKSVQQIVSAALRLNWIIYLREDARYDNYNLSFHNYFSWTQQGNGVRKVCDDITLQKRGKTRAESGAKKLPHWTLQPLISSGFSACPFQQRLKF